MGVCVWAWQPGRRGGDGLDGCPGWVAAKRGGGGRVLEGGWRRGWNVRCGGGKAAEASNPHRGYRGCGQQQQVRRGRSAHRHALRRHLGEVAAANRALVQRLLELP
eukprot:362935-Chlamydomonas_euryale.AAC.4